MQQKKISLWQISLLSTGGMIGSGWLFSPFFGYQTAGIGVILSWIIAAFITFIIGLTFAEVSSILPIVGGISRFIGVTHSSSTAFLFLIIGWLSYVVYLPLEAQSVIQYLGYWFPILVVKSNDQFQLSRLGVSCAVIIIFSITWFNTLIITKVTKANAIISFWKIGIPLVIALVVIIGFGNWHTLVNPHNFSKVSGENIFLAITESGLVFAFSGFQNGLILANNVDNPKKALPYSLFSPIIIGLILYILLSLCFLTTLNTEQKQLINMVAPLLGLISLLGLNILFTILFMDAIIAPLGTTNVYVAVTSRILLGLGKDFLPNSWITKLNKNQSPEHCLWVNAFIAIIFLFPVPTWKELVSFLSSIAVFAYLAGPVSLLVLRSKKLNIPRKFSIKGYKFFGYFSYICGGLLMYWSGLKNLIYLNVTLTIILIIYIILNKSSIFRVFINNSYLLCYIIGLTVISYCHKKNIIGFPLDNYLVIIIGFVGCYLFVKSSLATKEIKLNLEKIHLELESDIKANKG